MMSKFWQRLFPYILVSRKWRDKVDKQIYDIERHFATKRDQDGRVVETLADIPVDKREEMRKKPIAGRTWQQQKAWLERTDGGRHN